MDLRPSSELECLEDTLTLEGTATLDFTDQPSRLRRLPQNLSGEASARKRGWSTSKDALGLQLLLPQQVPLPFILLGIIGHEQGSVPVSGSILMRISKVLAPSSSCSIQQT